MDATFGISRPQVGRRFGALVALVAIGYLIAAASGFLVRATFTDYAGSANLTPAVSRFDVTLKAGERPSQDDSLPLSDLTRAQPAEQASSTPNSIVEQPRSRRGGPQI
jgi:hypothetical protein